LEAVRFSKSLEAEDMPPKHATGTVAQDAARGARGMVILALYFAGREPDVSPGVKNISGRRHCFK
jgi:hypothetical protein